MNAPRQPAFDDHRLQVAIMSLGNAALQAMVLALFAWKGDMSVHAVAAFVTLSLGMPFAFALLVCSGWSRRLEVFGDEPLRERERISCEVHDKLLQGVQGLVLRFQTAADRIPPDSPARRMMDEALERADQVLAEGRDRVDALRLANGESHDLVEALSSTGEGLSLDFGARFHFEVLGERRPVQHEDDLCRIARDVIVDAFQHPATQEVSVQLHYGSEGVDLRVLDDTDGATRPRVDQHRRGKVLASMDDRVCRVGAQLSVSRAAHGREVRLQLPAAVAYAGGAQAHATAADEELHSH